jgi:acetyl esterase/lipase
MMSAPRPWYRRPSRILPIAAAAAGLAMVVISIATPWPAALLIRAVFEDDANKTFDEMVPYVPSTPLESQLAVPTGTNGTGQTFDVFSPADSTGPLPTVVWIHGGAWISGDSANVRPYVEIIAGHGYTAVALNYTVAPEAKYPVALEQLNDSLGFLLEHAEEYRIDPTRVVLAGDSAGANLASQLAALTTSPEYATEVGVTPSLSPEQLRGMVLNCGIYDVSGVPGTPGLAGWGFREALWAYLGERDWSTTVAADEMSTMGHVTAAFPATWISGGNGDPLTASQSKPLAAKLAGLGVDVTGHFFPDDLEPALPHEYQFHLDREPARIALESTLEFLAEVTTAS